MRTLIVCTALATAFATSAAEAKPAQRVAAPGATTATASIEVTESAAQAVPATVRFDAAVSRDRPGPELRVSTDDTAYSIELQWITDRQTGKPTVSLELELSRPDQPPLRVRVARAEVALGQRTVLASVPRPGSGRLEVAITLRP